MGDKIALLQKLIDSSQRIVFFGGAGVSTESGIKDFRSKDGLYKLQSKYGVPYEIILSRTYFDLYPKTFYEFYREFMINKDAKPNAAHKYLAELEKRKQLTVITQNIDGLHQMAGSRNVLELHGSIYRNHCLSCGEYFDIDAITSTNDIPKCPHCGGIIKPDVVLYEEQLDNYVLDASIRSIEEADLLIVAGTSLAVYPANGLIRYFRGNKIVVINKDHLTLHDEITLEINSPIGEVFSKLK